MQYLPLIGTFWDEGSGNEYVGYVDTKTGKEVGTFADGTLFYDGCALVNGTEGWFFVDHKMQPLFPDTYFDATIFHDGVAWVAKSGGPLCAIDKKGNVLFTLKEAQTACAFYDGLAAFANADGKWGLVDKKGNVVVEATWKDVVPMCVNGMMAVKEDNNNWGVINTKGELIVPCLFQDRNRFMKTVEKL